MIKNILIVLLALGTVIGLGTSAFLYQRFSSSRPIMTIGSDKVTRKEFEDQLEYENGKTILNKLAFRKIILQAAKKANVVPTEKEVDARIAEIERRQPTLLDAAKRDEAKMGELRQDIKSNLAFENLRIKDVKLAPGDVERFYAENKAAFGVPTQVQTTLVVARNGVDASTAKDLLAQNVKPEVIARTPRLSVVGLNGFEFNAAALPSGIAAQLQKTVFAMREGDTASIAAGPAFGNQFPDAHIIVRLNKRAVAGVPPLPTVLPLATRMAKMAQAPAPDETLAKLYKDANVVFEMDKYSAYFSDVEERSRQQAPAPKKKVANNGASAPVAANARP